MSYIADQTMENEFPVYRYLVRSRVDTAFTFGGAYYPKDVDNFEPIQRSSNTMVEELKGMEYNEYNEGLVGLT